MESPSIPNGGSFSIESSGVELKNFSKNDLLPSWASNCEAYKKKPAIKNSAQIVFFVIIIVVLKYVFAKFDGLRFFQTNSFLSYSDKSDRYIARDRGDNSLP